MASSSTSLVQTNFKYDVFLSFRGEDTRKTFVDHLYKALDDKGIITYKDDEKIQKGEKINEQLARSIEESRFYIIVFSKNYASSSWCLEELVKIIECQKRPDHTAYPIFFDVEPTEIRHQTGAVKDAFAEHVEKAAAGRWRLALKEAADLAGWELKNTLDGHEAKFIQKIVVDILLKLSFINWSVDEDLVGMETRVENVVSSLEIGSEDVRMIGIWGMGGSGKTTLATAVFDRIADWFEGTSFVENVRELSKSSLSGLKELQKQVLSDVLKDQSIVVRSVSDGKNKLIKMMGSRKVLIVLDDVDNIGQLEVLAGKPNWFKPGSRIIITTRDEQVLIAHGVHNDDIHDACLLSNEEAICLFSKYAFKREVPSQGYEELSKKVIHYAAGLPLTIKVLGSFLCGRIEREWVDAIERLKTIPLKETLEKLELSYNGLENDQKEIFLDVACILKGERIDTAIRVLESCGFRAQIGLRVLEQRSLITISDDHHKYLGMHDHIEEMGQNIVRRLHPHEPSKHSRLWIKDEIEHILINGLVTESRSIKLEHTDLNSKVIMEGLRNMRELRVLDVDNGYGELQVDEVSQYFPEMLQSLRWYKYDFGCLPKTFQANMLVNLSMVDSNISQLWEGGERKVLNNIRFLNLSFSDLKTLDLRMTPRLEKLDLTQCQGFVELQLPVECPNLKSFDLSGSKLRTFDLRMTPRLEKLHLGGNRDFVELYLPIECPNLKSLNLNNSKLRTFDVRLTPRLETLDLGQCNEFVELYLPIECPNLKSINLSGSKLRTFDLGLTPHLENLNLSECHDFVELHLPFECSNLKFLNLSDSKVRNLNLGMTPHLELLDLKDCSSLQEFNAPVGCLKNLNYITLSGCLGFKYFVVKKDYKSGPTFILNVDFSDTCRLHPDNKLPKFKLDCKYEESLPSWSENLFSFGLCACTNLGSFSAWICGLQHLKWLRLRGGIPEALFNNITDDNYMLKHLKSLILISCERLEQIPENICRLECLKELYLSTCIRIKKLPEELGSLKCLEQLHITSCESLRDISDSICNMNCLKCLCLSGCILIEKLPEELGRLEFLQKLCLERCESLRDIPNSICNMKSLKSLNLSHCILIEKLPEELGRFECLQELCITGCKSLRDIPKSMKCLMYVSLSSCIPAEKMLEIY